MPSLTPASAELTGILLQTLLYGVYLILFSGTASVFVKAYRDRKNVVLSVVNATLFVLITVHWIIQLVRLFEAFAYHGYAQEATSTYYSRKNDATFIAKSVLYYAQTVFGDLMMVYRLHIVWNHNWKVVIPPIVAITLYVVVAIYETYTFTRPISSINAEIPPWVVLMIFLTLFDTFYITGCITWQIWKLKRVFQQFTSPTTSNLGPVIQIVIESATLYTSCGILYVVAVIARSPLQFIALDMISPVVGISFCLIIVRSSYRHRDHDYSMPSMPSSCRTWGHSASQDPERMRALVSDASRPSEMYSVRRVYD